MKRILIIAAAILLALLPFSAFAEETGDARETDPAEEVRGDWYAALHGFSMRLTLGEDGGYTMVMQNQPSAEPANGTWEYREGFVWLDGDTDRPLSYDDGILSMRGIGLYFYRDPAEVYLPAETDPEAAQEDFAGSWRMAFMLSDGVAIPASALNLDLYVYIERNRVALTGDLLDGDTVIDFTFENGALSFTAEDLCYRLEKQQDYYLRLTVTAGGQETVAILGEYIGEGLIPEEETAGEP